MWLLIGMQNHGIRRYYELVYTILNPVKTGHAGFFSELLGIVILIFQHLVVIFATGVAGRSFLGPESGNQPV